MTHWLIAPHWQWLSDMCFGILLHNSSWQMQYFVRMEGDTCYSVYFSLLNIRVFYLTDKPNKSWSPRKFLLELVGSWSSSACCKSSNRRKPVFTQDQQEISWFRGAKEPEKETLEISTDLCSKILYNKMMYVNVCQDLMIVGSNVPRFKVIFVPPAGLN